MQNINEIYEIVFESFDHNTDMNSNLDDLDFDSMAQIILIGELEERHGIILETEELSDLHTLNDLTNLIKNKI